MTQILCDSEMVETDEKVIIQEDGVKFIKGKSKGDQDKITK